MSPTAFPASKPGCRCCSRRASRPAASTSAPSSPSPPPTRRASTALYPRKGTIAVGSDADLVLWNPERQVTITNDILHHAVDYTPYEGRTVTGWPQTVVARGNVIVRDGAFVGHAGDGRFLACTIPGTTTAADLTGPRLAAL